MNPNQIKEYFKSLNDDTPYRKQALLESAVVGLGIVIVVLLAVVLWRV